MSDGRLTPAQQRKAMAAERIRTSSQIAAIRARLRTEDPPTVERAILAAVARRSEEIACQQSEITEMLAEAVDRVKAADLAAVRAGRT